MEQVMVNSRDKGARFERLICTLINKHLIEEDEKPAKRNLDQTREGGCDIIFKKFAIECKFYQKGKNNWAQEQWWEQACKSAGTEYIPVLIYKYNTKPIRIVIPVHAIDPKQPVNNEVHLHCEVKALCNDFKSIIKNADDIL
tara:strand:- start:2155 stop:2580 length:426 start_codon:yes stop_codon:yes gene_type:complete